MTIAKYVLVVCALSSYGCASIATDPLEENRTPGAEDVARALGCTEEEIAICVGANCKLDDYSCVDREEARGMFGGGQPH